MGDFHLEYAGVPPARLAAWQDVLRDASALDQLWPYLESVPRLVDAKHPHVAAQLDSLRRLFADKKGDAGLNLAHALDAFEALLLGLIGPEGQSPCAPRQWEIPLQPYTEAWFTLAFGSPNLLWSPATTQALGRRIPRAYLLPEQVKALAAVRPPRVDLEACRRRIESWNATASVQRFLGTLDVEDRARYETWQARFLEVAGLLAADLAAFASRGEAYVGWTAWYGYE